MAAPKNKNTPSTQRVRRLDGQPVRGVLYNGRALGHGKPACGAPIRVIGLPPSNNDDEETP